MYDLTSFEVNIERPKQKQKNGVQATVHILCVGLSPTKGTSLHSKCGTYIQSTNIRKISNFKRFVRQIEAKNVQCVMEHRHTSVATDKHIY